MSGPRTYYATNQLLGVPPPTKEVPHTCKIVGQWTMLCKPRIQILHAELVNRAQNQLTSLPTEQWFGRIYGKGF